MKLNIEANQGEPDPEHPERPLLPTFQRLYTCFKACKDSFMKCRPSIGLDGCFLKGYYGGVILPAVGRDRNDQMLPIAVAVVEGETKDSWSWFLDFLVNDLGGQRVCTTYTFISDQQKGLLPAMEELLPGVEQRFCVRHRYNNFRKRHPGKQLEEMMWKEAKATYPQAWENIMRDMRRVSEPAYLELMKTPPRFWSKSRFSASSKCDVLVNNMSETFNSVILGARQKPIVTMMEEIRVYLMERCASNRQKINTYSGSILPRIQKRLDKEKHDSRLWLLRMAGEHIFEVRHINQLGDRYCVNLMQKKCSCRKWMLTGISCAHVISCMNHVNQVPEDNIPAYFRKETYHACYEPIVYPTNGQNMWTTTEFSDIAPPPLKRPPGRPKRSRKKDESERRKDESKVSRQGLPNKCSKCKQTGHNKRCCKGPPAAGNQAQPAAHSQPVPNTAQSQPQTQNAIAQSQTEVAGPSKRSLGLTRRATPTADPSATSAAPRPKLNPRRPVWK